MDATQNHLLAWIQMSKTNRNVGRHLELGRHLLEDPGNKDLDSGNKDRPWKQGPGHWKQGPGPWKLEGVGGVPAGGEFEGAEPPHN